MAEIPQPSERIVTSEAPRSNISPGEVAQPYAMLGHALDKLGEGLEEVAIPIAERAGAQAVTRDAAGDIQVEHAPIFGRAGIAYARAVKMGALAEAEGQAKQDDIALREKFRDNPEGYRVAAAALRKTWQDKMTAAAGPEVGVAVGRAVDSTTTMTFRGLLNEKERLDLARAESQLKARMDTARDNAMAMGRAGIGTDNPDMQREVGAFIQVADERMRNPRLAYSKEEHDHDINEFKSQIGGQVFIHEVEKVYKDSGIQVAEERAKDIQTNPAYKDLSIAQRDHYYHQALGTIRADEAIRKQDLGMARTALSEMQLASHEGMTIPYEDGDKIVKMFVDAGDPGGAARAQSVLIRMNLNHDYGEQPLPAQTRQLEEWFDRMSVPRAYQPLIQKAAETSGFDIGTLSRLLKQESNFNPNAVSPAGAVGVAQFMPKTAADYGINPRNPDEAIPAAGRLLRDLSTRFEGNQGLALAAYNWGPENVEKWKAAGADPARMPAETRNYVQTITGSPIQAWMGGRGVVTPDINPATSMWRASNMQRQLDKDSWNAWSQIRKDYDAEKIVPSAKRVNEIRDAAFASGNHMLLDTIDHDTQRMNLAQTFSQESLPEQNAAIGRLEQAGTTHDLEPGHAAILKDFQSINAKVTEGLKDNPVRTTANYFADMPNVKMPPPLNMEDRNEFVQGLKMRAQLADFGAQNWKTGPLSALDKADIAQVAGALETADVPTKARILGDITASLPEHIRNATLAKLGEQEKMMTTVAAAGLQREAPDVATSVLRGEQAVKLDPRNDPRHDPNNKKIFDDNLDAYLPGSLFPEAARTDPKGPMAAMRGAVGAIVANKLSEPNSKRIVDADMVRDAVDQVTGGVLVSPGGSSIIAPKRGMLQGQFDAVLAGLRDSDFPDVSTLAGEPINARYVQTAGELESLGDGRYRIKIGNNYVFQGAHELSADALRPFVLDLRGRAPVPNYRPPAQPNLTQMFP